MPGRRNAMVVEGPSEYEQDIERQRAENKALLAKLKADCASNGVPLPSMQPIVKKVVAKPSSRKRKATEPTAPSRKSARISQKVVNFQELTSDDDDEPIRRRKKTPKSKQQLDKPAKPKGPRVNAKVFGPIGGVEVGDWWALRTECGATGVHPPTVAGIYGAAEDGCYSVAVSAGYPEDRDNGDCFTYTGSGGRELQKKNLRTGPQSRDQELIRGNAALDKSAQTGNPIRVIRGYKAPLGPVTGYRYDGLYKVIRSYQSMNSEGKYKVYKFDFERLPGQPPVDYQLKSRYEAEEATNENGPPTPPASGDEGKEV